MYQTKYCAVATLLNATNEIVWRKQATGMLDLNRHPSPICSSIPTIVNTLKYIIQINFIIVNGILSSYKNQSQ